jgi:hypothetical protein
MHTIDLIIEMEVTVFVRVGLNELLKLFTNITIHSYLVAGYILFQTFDRILSLLYHLILILATYSFFFSVLTNLGNLFVKVAEHLVAYI